MTQALSKGPERVAEIRKRLTAALAPVALEVVDDSARHAGHEGARDGRGHFNVSITSPAFVGKRQIQRHRMVYAVLGELMQTDIHALSLSTRAPSE